MRTIPMGIQVMHNLRVYREDGSLFWSDGPKPKPNMITEVGLDQLSNHGEADMLTNLHYGTDGTPTNKSTGDNVVVQVGRQIVSPDVGLFEDIDGFLGRWIWFSNNKSARITNRVSANEVTIDRDIDVDGTSCAVYFTEQSRLIAETGTSTDVSTDTGLNGVTVFSKPGLLTITRTRTLRATVAAGGTISELAISHDGGPDVFARYVPSDPITVPPNGVIEDTVTIATLIDTTLSEVPGVSSPIRGIEVPVSYGVPDGFTIERGMTNWVDPDGTIVPADVANNVWTLSPCSPYTRDGEQVGLHQLISAVSANTGAIGDNEVFDITPPTFSREVREKDYVPGTRVHNLQANLPACMFDGPTRSLILCNSLGNAALQLRFDSRVTIPATHQIKFAIRKRWGRSMTPITTEGATFDLGSFEYLVNSDLVED